MTIQEQHLREMLRDFSGPVDLYRRRIKEVMGGYGLRLLELPARGARSACGTVLVYSREEDLFGTVYLTAALRDEGSVVLLELARSLSISCPQVRTVFVFHDCDRMTEETFPFLVQEDGFFSCSLVLNLNPPRPHRLGGGLLTICANDDDPYLPGIVLQRMRHFGIALLYRQGRTRRPEAQARRLELAYREPYNLTNMGALALWLEELLFVIIKSRADYLWQDDPLELPEKTASGTGFFVMGFPEQARQSLDPEGRLSGQELSGEIGRLFLDERDQGAMALFT